MRNLKAQGSDAFPPPPPRKYLWYSFMLEADVVATSSKVLRSTNTRPQSSLETSGTEHRLRHHNFSEELISHSQNGEHVTTGTDWCKSWIASCHLLRKAVKSHNQISKQTNRQTKDFEVSLTFRLANQALCCLLGQWSSKLWNLC